MKKLLYALCIAALSYHATYGQVSRINLRERSEKNLSYLTSSKVLLDRIQINDWGIAISEKHYRQPEFYFYWDEIAKFVDLIEHKDFYTLQQVYKSKRSVKFAGARDVVVPENYEDLPMDFENLRVALDPGHFGGDLEEARLEGRLVKIKGVDISRTEDIKFFEADLTYHTALVLKQKLEERGAQVMLTRPYGAGALDKSFSEWLRTSFNTDLNRSWKLGDLQKSFYDTLTNAYLDTTSTRSRYFLFQFYKFLDFRARSQRINDFHPNITFIIHYNASEAGRPYNMERYIRPVSTNYSMAFVPGSFEFDEFEKSDQKLDFIRLLLSPDLINSMRLANLWVQKHNELLGVPPVPYDSLQRMKAVIIRTPYEGVFSRNLYLTRSVHGMVVYGESLYQDNFQEALNLSLKDYEIVDPMTDRVHKTSSRCVSVAEAYFQSVSAFIEQNKALKSQSPGTVLQHKQ